MPKLLEGLKTWLQSMNDASASDVAVLETFEKRAEAPTPVEASSRLQSGAILGIFTMLVFYFLYFASPILIPIITALLLSMLLAPFVRLLELAHVPRTLGSLIVVVAAVGGLVGIAASLRDPAQSWLTDSQRFSRLEERLRPITAPFEKLQHATEQLEKATHREMGRPSRRWKLRGRGCRASSQLAVDTRRLRSLPSSPPLLLSRFRGHLLRKLVLVTPSLKDKKRAVDIVRNIETDISFYLVMVTAINIAIGFVVMATTAVLGIPDPLLWGTLAAVLSFAPYVASLRSSFYFPWPAL